MQSSQTKNKRDRLLAYALFPLLFFSGFAGLGYEMVWTRMLAVGLGHEIVAVLAVIAAFFTGMALGALSLDGIVSRSRRPGRWYSILELVIGLWSLVLIFLIPHANRLAAAFTGIDPSVLWHWTIAFVLPFFLLLPATVAMGATLPAMERLFSRLRRDDWSVGGLYAANTFGAVAGVMLTTFFIAPQIGFRTTVGVLAVVNFMCAGGVYFGAARKESERPPVSSNYKTEVSSWRIAATLFATGFLGIGYEVLMIRIVSQVLENTVFSFAALLSVYLLGTAAGAAIYQAVAPRGKFDAVLTWLLEGMAFFCVSGVALLPLSEALFLKLRNVTGGGFQGAIIGEIALAAAIFLFPTIIMGAAFSHLAQAARDRKGGLGSALCTNTLGASLAPMVFGLLLVPAIGSKLSLLALSAGYLLLIPPGPWTRWVTAAVPLGFAASLWMQSGSFNLVSLTPNSRITAHIEGVMAAVTVIEDKHGDYSLKVNNKFTMGGTASRFSDARQGHIPLLLHPDPKRALFLGLGTGATFAAAADHPGLEADGVELVPEIITVLPYFEKATGPIDKFSQLHIHVADARRFVNARRQSYDVIVADLFHPARDGAGFLYTVEHFEAIKKLLNPSGVFCQWLPLYQMDLEVLRTIIRTFMRVFPDGKGFLPTYSLQTPIIGLISGAGNTGYPLDYMEKRISDNGLQRRIVSLRLDSTYALFGNFIAGHIDLSHFAGNGPLNTDDQPVVIFKAPEFAYSGKEPAYIRLLALVDSLNQDSEQILKKAKTADAKTVHDRLRAYWTARDRFLHAGAGVRQTTSVELMLRQVRKPLLDIVRQSLDFEPAYSPLLAMARQLHRTNPDAARRLLIDLEVANPNRQDARRLREYLYN